MPRLIYDKSRLNQDRITVVWLSPNSWFLGSRYGNVEFNIDFSKVYEGRRAYWVETAAYKIPAPRILLSSASDLPDNLVPYDPSLRDGPWWHDVETNTHWWNGSITLEFMIDEPLRLRECSSISFCSHSKEYCCLHRNHPSACSDFGKLKDHGNEGLITELVLRNIRDSAKRLLIVDKKPSQELLMFGSGLQSHIHFRNGKDCAGTLTSDCSLAPILARSYLEARWRDREAEKTLIASQFASPEELCLACVDVVNAHFGLSRPGVLNE